MTPRYNLTGKIVCLLLLAIPICAKAQYTGTASVTQGVATIVTPNLYECTGGRKGAIGTITATDNTVWTVPAVVQYMDFKFPFASDLYNECKGFEYPTAGVALSKLDGSDVITIDSTGEVVTGFIFADNYFEMYVNGKQIGKDNVPYTPFNSSIVRFRVKMPFTIAMHLVDWEENLGIGTEAMGGTPHHDGDGGMVAVFYDENVPPNILATTGADWKAQTFYTSPIIDLSCPTENGSMRLSDKCTTQDSNDGSKYYALHWAVPTTWMNTDFDDSSWPAASTFANSMVGVDNKKSYTNFTAQFDNPSNDAQFIWSTNLILDNEVIVRKTVTKTSSVSETKTEDDRISTYPNPAGNTLNISLDNTMKLNDIHTISIYNSYGEKVYASNTYSPVISLEHFTSGLYLIKIQFSKYQITKKLIVQ
ncbi:MAG: T9SS type A sorting domain-containing protein [Ignavibacteriae bacterium]|nr:T9SS type A sorting domain-containing protein [Ignavibacteriota bacterium]